MSVEWFIIYNSRNYSILLNLTRVLGLSKSTTVEIILYYLTLILVKLQLDLQQ